MNGSGEHSNPRGAEAPPQPPAWWQTVFLAACLAGLVAGLAVLWRFEQTPGRSATIEAAWPAASRLVSDPRSPTLVMFAHPRCACTRASLANLRALIGPFTGRLVAYVAFMRPHEAGPEWLETGTLAHRSSIPDVAVV